MTTNTCQHCRHWTRNSEEGDGWVQESRLFGYCANPHLAYGEVRSETVRYGIKPYGELPPPDHYQEEPIEQCDDMLLYQDYSAFAAYMTTGQNFGCIHWDGAKEDD